MKEIKGTSNKVLEFDLNSGKSNIETISIEDSKKYLGGKGMALKLLFERLKPGSNPLGKENIFIVTTGVLIGTGAPNSARFSAVSKSPLTGIITHSSCGGPFGNALKTSGWDGLILRGKSDKLVYLILDSAGIKVFSADHLKEKSTSSTTKELEKFGNGSIVIGPAGENQVRFANIASGDRFLGRGGLGAVLGSKNIKGIVAKGGEFKIIPKNINRFKKISNRAFGYIKKNYYTNELYRNYGTLMYVRSNNKAGILPVENFSKGSHPEAERISGKYVKETFKTTFKSCKNCSILCGHEGTFKGKKTKVPEYESTALLGSDLGIFDMERITEWNYLCSEYGLDTITMGGTIAYLMETGEKFNIKTKLKFGKPDHISETITETAFARGFGREIGFGSKYLSEKYGGADFAIHAKGMEIGGYDPRGSYGMGLNYAVANRGGCHLSSILFGLEVTTGFIPPKLILNKANYVVIFENIVSAINSVHTCLFTLYPYLLESKRMRYIPRLILKPVMTSLPVLAKPFLSFSIYSGLYSSITGIKLSNRNFYKAGERTHLLERMMNCREGINSNADILPKKLMHFNHEKNADKVFPLKRMLKKYYRLRKYEKTGAPSLKYLKKTGVLPLNDPD